MTDTLRQEFEAAYRESYAVSCQINPDKFRQELDGLYDSTIVQVAWTLYQAGRRAGLEKLRGQEPVAWLREPDLRELADCNYMHIGADSPKIWAPNDISTPSPDMGLIPVYAAPHPAPEAKQEPVLQDIEQYRMQMAGICTAALGYWKEGDGVHPDYDTPALRDVARLYAKYDELYKANRAPEATVNAQLLEALKALMPYVESHDDAGPYGAGWQSSELEAKIESARVAIVAAEQAPDAITSYYRDRDRGGWAKHRPEAGYTDIVSDGGMDPRNALEVERKRPDDTEGGDL